MSDIYISQVIRLDKGRVVGTDGLHPIIEESENSPGRYVLDIITNDHNNQPIHTLTPNMVGTFTDSLPAATLSQAGITRLLTSINNTMQDMAITPKSVQLLKQYFEDLIS